MQIGLTGYQRNQVKMSMLWQQINKVIALNVIFVDQAGIYLG
jgi:hypothetical protein